jgi:hypothetical protein
MEKNYSKSTGATTSQPNWIEVVQQQVSALRFGVVQVTVHDSRVVQIETTERVRFDKPQQPESH